MADFDYIGINVTAAQIERIAGMGINTEQVTENSGNDEIPTSKAVYEGIVGSVEDNYSASSKKAQSGIAVGLAIENSVDKIQYSSGSHEITNVREALDALFKGGAASLNSEQVSHSLQVLDETENVKQAIDAIENFVVGESFKTQKHTEDLVAHEQRLDGIDEEITNLKNQGGGAYELIETITTTEGETAITRTQEPDGAAYNFTDIFVVATWVASSGIAYIVQPYFGSKNIKVFRQTGTIAANAVNLTHIKSTGNLKQVYVSMPNTNKGIITANDDLMTSNAHLFTDDNITKLVLSTTTAGGFPAGTKFELWGVRA